MIDVQLTAGIGYRDDGGADSSATDVATAQAQLTSDDLQRAGEGGARIDV